MLFFLVDRSRSENLVVPNSESRIPLVLTADLGTESYRVGLWDAPSESLATMLAKAERKPSESRAKAERKPSDYASESLAKA